MTLEHFLAPYDSATQALILQVCQQVIDAVPDVRMAPVPGWKLVGFRIPVGKKTAYFGYVAPQPGRVVVGFEYGVLLSDPQQLLSGTGSQVRQLILKDARALDALPARALADFLLQAAAIAGDRMRLRAPSKQTRTA